MELYRLLKEKELVFSSYIEYSEKDEAYAHVDDNAYRTHYGLFEKVDEDNWEIYKEWCEQKNLKPYTFKTIRFFFQNIQGFGCDLDYKGLKTKHLYIMIDNVKYFINFRIEHEQVVKKALSYNFSKLEFKAYLEYNNAFLLDMREEK